MQAAFELARLAGETEAKYWRSWFEAVRAIDGDPFAIDILSFGAVTAILCEAIPRSDYNRVLQVCDEEARCLQDVMRHYHERHTPFRVDVIPEWCSSEVLDELDAIGFRPSDFQTVLAGEPSRRIARLPRCVTVRDVEDDDLELFVRIHEEAYYGIGQPQRLRDFRAASIRARFATPGWRFYLAFVNGVPAGGGALHIEGSAATLAGGATLEALRGRGCQAVLLQRRLHDAAELGCDLVFGRGRSGSVSQRNMERAGLRTVFTKTIWTHRWTRAGWSPDDPRGITRPWPKMSLPASERMPNRIAS
jgi:hypothetical protein